MKIWRGLFVGGFALWLCADGNAQSQEHLYAPPFQKGKRFLVVQGFNGNYSHNTPIARYAVDLALPEGEDVCAARAGTVIDLYDGNETKKSHFVYIQHNDGSIGDYEHLLPFSIQVGMYQEVEEGECFAKSGNTGNSSGPHLHFAVLKYENQFSFKLISIPFRFKYQTEKIMRYNLMWINNQLS